MKRIFACILSLIMIATAMLGLASCDIGTLQGGEAKPLSAPTNLKVVNATLSWNPVENAIGYTLKIQEGHNASSDAVGDEIMLSDTEYSLTSLKDGEYTLSVKARGDSVVWSSSAYSTPINYTRTNDTGADYGDKVVGAFGEFDEINTRESYLGYGINIINANGITSQNIKLNYPIFSKDALLDEILLKSNEHYSNLETIEAATIEEFKEKLAASTSISSGASVSASGNLFGVNASGGVSLSQGLKASFEKTSSETYSQYFLEIIAENQNYWLVLQTEESRYREILSEEFKQDLYNPYVTPAQLFDKYGTHLLTSVAMGGNISMFYTLYSTKEEVTSSQYYEVSSKIKAGVDASYSGLSTGISGENAFAATFTHEEVANKYGIRIEKKIVTSGGSGSFGIINEQSLYNNYADWQASLDAYPVVIGIKDSNSLYPIWNLIDTSVEGGAERYAELYEYFMSYGVDSYNELVSAFGIQPPVAPTEIINIRTKTTVDYQKGDTIQVKPGDTFKITFDVLPVDATKYRKTFYTAQNEYVKIDEDGNVTVSENAPSRMSFTVTVGAGNVERDIEFYIVQSCMVNFNTGYSSLTVPSVVVESSSFVEAPIVERVGYTLEGWYLDTEYTLPFDFENARVTSSITLYAKWRAIEPIVTFDSMGGSDVTSQLLKYNGTVKVPNEPTRDGYVFLGWYANRSGTEPFDFTAKITEDTTVYALWELIVYTVTFDSMGGVAISPKTTHINAEYLISEVAAERSYYTFDGWYRDAQYHEKFYFESKITEDITLYAKWTPIPVYVSFVDVGGGELVDEDGLTLSQLSTNVTKNFLLDGVRTPVKEGYTFAGWKQSGQLVDLTAKEFLPTKNAEAHVLVATWTVNSYTLKYTVDGDTVKEFTYAYGAQIEEYTPDERVGYRFDGWDKVPAAMPAEDVTVKGSYSVMSFTLTYILDGVQYGEVETLTYGAAITVRPDPEVEHKDDFSGWEYKGGAVPETMPAENVTITGVFGSECYEFNCYVDGEPIVDSMLVKVNSVIPVPEAPTKTGYDFIGWTMNGDDDVWFEEGMLMPAENTELYAQFALKKITVTVNYAFDKEDETKASTVLTDVPYGEAYSIEIEEVTGFTPDKTTVSGIAGEEDITLTVTYSSNAYTLTVQYIDFDGSVLEVRTSSVIYKTSYQIDAVERTGYTASVEDTLAERIMPAADHTVTVRYTKNAYKISVTLTKSDHNKVTGTVDVADSYLYGDEYSIALPTETGYTAYVDGTATDTLTGTVGADDITVEVVYKPNTYTITYILNGSSTPPYSPTLVASDASYTFIYNTTSDLATASAVGYSFDGWYDANGKKIANATGELVANTDGYTDAQGNWIIASDVTLYAQWTPYVYTVTYNANGGSGSTYSSTHVYDVSKALSANSFARSGYEFLGWSTDASASAATYADKASVVNLTAKSNGTVALYAVWIKIEADVSSASRSKGIIDNTVTDTFCPELERDRLIANGYESLKLTVEVNGKGYTVWDDSSPYFIICSQSGEEIEKIQLDSFPYNDWDPCTKTVTISLDKVKTDGTFMIKYGNNDHDAYAMYYLGTVFVHIEAVKY